MKTGKHLRIVFLLGAACLLCCFLVPVLLWYLVDVGNYVRAFLTFLAMAFFFCVGVMSIDALTAVLCVGVGRAQNVAGRRIGAVVRLVVRIACLLFQAAMVVMVVIEAQYAHYPLWARVCALLVPAVAAAGNALLLRAEKRMKAQNKAV